MSGSGSTTEVMEALMTLRRALRASLPGADGTPGLTGPQAQVLLQLAHAGPLSMGALAWALGTSYPAATDLVDRLEAAGHIERVLPRDDRRKVTVHLTPAARALAEGVLAERRDKVASVLAELSDEERPGFLRGITMLARAMSASAGVWATDAPLWFREVLPLTTSL